MLNYLSASKEELNNEYLRLKKDFDNYKAMGLNLDMSRGKPGSEQLDLSNDMFDVIKSDSDFKNALGFDCRNYGLLEGIDEMKDIFSSMLDVPKENIMVGGNSSLNMMFDTIACFIN